MNKNEIEWTKTRGCSSIYESDLFQKEVTTNSGLEKCMLGFQAPRTKIDIENPFSMYEFVALTNFNAPEGKYVLRGGFGWDHHKKRLVGPGGNFERGLARIIGLINLKDIEGIIDVREEYLISLVGQFPEYGEIIKKAFRKALEFEERLRGGGLRFN